MTFQNDCHALQQTPIFRDVDAAKLKLIAVASHRITHEPGDELFHEGGLPTGVLVILEGKADVFRKGATGPVLLARVGAGETVGEMSVLSGGRYSASVVAATHIVALEIEKNAFMEIMQTVPQIALAVARELGRRLELAGERIAALTAS